MKNIYVSLGICVCVCVCVSVNVDVNVMGCVNYGSEKKKESYLSFLPLRHREK